MTFEVETSSLQSTINSMETELENIVNITNRLYASLSELNKTWRGEAHTTFVLQCNKDQQAMSQVISSINDAIEDLEKAKKEYDSCEQSVKNRISRISI